MSYPPSIRDNIFCPLDRKKLLSFFDNFVGTMSIGKKFTVEASIDQAKNLINIKTYCNFLLLPYNDAGCNKRLFFIKGV